MDEQQAGRILREFSTHRQSLATEPTGPIWKWAEGVLLFPESICPRCNAAMRSNRIWHVDEKGQRVLGCWSMQDGQLKRIGFPRMHPNVHPTNGHVCMGERDGGGAASVSQALFLGRFNNPYWNPGTDWFQAAFDHTCGQRQAKGGLAAELDRLVKRQPVGLTPPPATQPADDEPIFGRVPSIPSPLYSSADIDSVFGRQPPEPPRRRRGRTAVVDMGGGGVSIRDDSPMFDGSMTGGISAD